MRRDRLLNSGNTELLDLPRLGTQLTGLERRSERHDKPSDTKGWTNLKQLHGEFVSVPSDSGQTDVAHEHDGTQLSAN